jgi:hypothetical protein
MCRLSIPHHYRCGNRLICSIALSDALFGWIQIVIVLNQPGKRGNNLRLLARRIIGRYNISAFPDFSGCGGNYNLLGFGFRHRNILSIFISR